MSTPQPWPSEDDSRRLADGLARGDTDAPSRFVAAFLASLTDYLRRWFPHADPHDCETAAGNTLLAAVARADGYDPLRLGPGAFLRMAAQRDLRNILRGQTRHRRGIPLESVAEPADTRNTSRDADGPSWDDPRLVTEIAAFDPAERAALELMRNGERGTEAFARALGLPDDPPGGLAAEVKRVKDRIKKRLARAVGGAE